MSSDGEYSDPGEDLNQNHSPAGSNDGGYDGPQDISQKLEEDSLDSADFLSVDGVSIKAEDSDFEDDEYQQISSSDNEIIEEPTRPNKYRGPRSTWRNWTKRERQEAAALELIQARDLSIHLYNAFMLKKRAKMIKQRNKSIASTLNMTTTTGSSQDQILPVPFAPSKFWTAWPMPVNETPLLDEHAIRHTDDIATFRMAPDGRPSADLEELIIARMLKVSKERFNERPWQRGGDSLHIKRENRSLSRPRSSTDGDESEFTEVEKDIVDLRPVVLADDEMARKLLRPEARHILQKFEELLMNLHEARKAYITMKTSARSKLPGGSETASENENQDEEDEDEDVEMVDIPNDSPNHPAKRKRGNRPPSAETGFTDDDDDDDDDDDYYYNEEDGSGKGLQRLNKGKANLRDNSKPSSSGDEKGIKKPSRAFPIQTRGQQTRQEALGPRDWSDVIGLATMAGLPDAAVMRAARRCADLFGQDASYRTLNEGSVQLAETEDGIPCWKYIEAEDFQDGRLGKSVNAQHTPKETEIDKPKGYAYSCPVEGCSRRLKGFSRKWNLNQHIKTRHPEMEIT
ncbi:hypothetical protein FQN57_000841 [Myotisia sp. PD_48]|nr:hypothetical protein FQN57_000841 [Myotisia sp. PD_48]